MEGAKLTYSLMCRCGQGTTEGAKLISQELIKARATITDASDPSSSEICKSSYQTKDEALLDR